MIEDVTETGALAYLYWAAGDEWALTGEVRYDVYEYDEGRIAKPEELRTFSTPLGVRYFNPNGLFAGAGLTCVSQDVQRGSASTFPDGDDCVLPRRRQRRLPAAAPPRLRQLGRRQRA